MRVMLACFVQAMRENICKHQWRELDEAEANDLGDDKYLQNTPPSVFRKSYYCCSKCGSKRLITRFNRRM